MVHASPRTQFRRLIPVIANYSPESPFERHVVTALRQLQEHMLLYPTGIRTLTADGAMIDTDLLILGDATGGSITVTLLTAAARAGRRIVVKQINAGANTVTIDAAGSETLDSATTVTLIQKNASREYISDGTNWKLVSAVGTATEL